MLLDKGADPAKVNVLGGTALSLGKTGEKRSQDLIDLLRQAENK
ncbi:MAG: hypothetical protein OEZ04_11425 [Nitrospinota bacterium]|nr:hypothetical protein [Nitrospinota bacterium]